MCVRQLEEGRREAENAYARSVRREGNPAAQKAIRSVFEVCDRAWRGIGLIPMSGYRLMADYADFDAERRFPDLEHIRPNEASVCVSGEVLRGMTKPNECPAFATKCSPENPLGATMVSSEGACAAYYRYRRLEDKTKVNSEQAI